MSRGVRESTFTIVSIISVSSEDLEA